MPTIKFATNCPQELRLRTIEGKPVDSQFGGVQHMFSAEEGAFYVSEAVGRILTEQLRALHIRPGDLVEILKAEVDRGGGRKGIQWQVAAVGYTPGYTPGERPDGTLAAPKGPSRPEPPSELEQKLADSIALAERRKQAVSAAAPAWADALVQQSNVLIDAYSAVVSHAAKYPNVRPEDVRSIFLSTFINAAKGANGGRNAA